MCRLAIYLGCPILLSHFVTEPNNSIIKQSAEALAEKKLRLNGDGFGIAWYVHHDDVTPHAAVFTEVTPAWSNRNLLELCKITTSTCILAHVRQASPGSSVVSTNCHPFSYKKFSFMHNGFVGRFDLLKRKIINLLSDEAYITIKGSTDSEHLFGLFLEFYRQAKKQQPTAKKLDLMAESLCKVISTVEELAGELKKDSKYKPEEFLSLLNIVITDGHMLVATRFTTGELTGAHTMFYCTGKTFQCHQTGHTSVHKNTDVEVTDHNQVECHEKMVIISSEPLTNDDNDFKPIPVNCITHK